MIRIALLAELGIGIAFVLVMIFQVGVPLIKGTPFFPFLRHRPKAAVAKLAEATEEKEVLATEAATMAMLGQGMASTVMFAADQQKRKNKAKSKNH